jgi:toxin ParE1/3/4
MRKATIAWLTLAAIEKDEIVDYIAERNVLAALGVDQQIGQQVAQLADFPFLGKAGREPDTFELVITKTPYIVAYRVYGDEVQILHVFHEKRNWPLTGRE